MSELAHISILVNARVVKEAIASVQFKSRFLFSPSNTFSDKYFQHNTVGELTVITPNEEGLASPKASFITLFSSFKEYVESETEKTKRMRQHVYDQIMSLFHNDLMRAQIISR